MRTEPIGLYIHIPFCKRKCRYCDFCSFTDGDKEKYIDALIKDINSYDERKISINTVFFGGGTPSLLSGEEFKKIFSGIRKAFNLTPDAEITLEANPKTLTSPNLYFYMSEGVNRISLGLQSIHENELVKLGRIHTYENFIETYNMVRTAGINNINVDLMYGIPGQTMESFESTVRSVAKLSPTHISLYGLILEEGTPLYMQREQFIFPTEDEEADMYYLGARLLSEFGYRHYEVSNYCLSGMECRHNLKYWRDKEYIGVGLSAYSYLDSKRYGKTKDMKSYLLNPLANVEEELIDKDREKYEYIMMRTRLSEGFSLSEYEELFGENFVLSREKKIREFADLGYVSVEGGRFSFTEKGMYVGNSLLTELI